MTLQKIISVNKMEKKIQCSQGNKNTPLSYISILRTNTNLQGV